MNHGRLRVFATWPASGRPHAFKGAGHLCKREPGGARVARTCHLSRRFSKRTSGEISRPTRLPYLRSLPDGADGKWRPPVLLLRGHQLPPFARNRRCCCSSQSHSTRSVGRRAAGRHARRRKRGSGRNAGRPSPRSGSPPTIPKPLLQHRQPRPPGGNRGRERGRSRSRCRVRPIGVGQTPAVSMSSRQGNATGRAAPEIRRSPSSRSRRRLALARLVVKVRPNEAADLCAQRAVSLPRLLLQPGRDQTRA